MKWWKTGTRFSFSINYLTIISLFFVSRSRGRHKFNIPIYDDDSNDLSDYGIGSSSSKTNSIKDVDTDDSCSILVGISVLFETRLN